MKGLKSYGRRMNINKKVAPELTIKVKEAGKALLNMYLNVSFMCGETLK